MVAECTDAEIQCKMTTEVFTHFDQCNNHSTRQTLTIFFGLKRVAGAFSNITVLPNIELI